MINKIPSDLFKPVGRTPRFRFVIALVIVAISIWLQGVAVRALGTSIWGFLLGLFWLVFNIYLLYTVFARRLHDINLSVGPFFAAILITILVLGVTAWVGGLDEYMAAMQANPEIANDAEANQALIEEYQANLEANLGWIIWVNYLAFALLALLGALKPSYPDANKYGPVPE